MGVVEREIRVDDKLLADLSSLYETISSVGGSVIPIDSFDEFLSSVFELGVLSLQALLISQLVAEADARQDAVSKAELN